MDGILAFGCSSNTIFAYVCYYVGYHYDDVWLYRLRNLVETIHSAN